MPDENSTPWLVETVFLQALTANVRAGLAIQHFHSDIDNPYPLISVKAVLREEDKNRYKLAGESFEWYVVTIAIEYPVTARDAGTDAFLSSAQLNYVTREVQKAIRLAGASAALANFIYFEIEPLLDADADLTENDTETPTLRVSVATLEAIVLRG